MFALFKLYNKEPVEKVRWELSKDAVCCFEQILEATPHKSCV